MIIFRCSYLFTIFLAGACTNLSEDDAQADKVAFACDTKIELVDGSKSTEFDGGLTTFILDERQNTIIESTKDGGGLPKPVNIFDDLIAAEWLDEFSVGNLQINRRLGFGTLKYKDRSGVLDVNKFYKNCQKVKVSAKQKVKF